MQTGINAYYKHLRYETNVEEKKMERGSTQLIFTVLKHTYQFVNRCLASLAFLIDSEAQPQNCFDIYKA